MDMMKTNRGLFACLLFVCLKKCIYYSFVALYVYGHDENEVRTFLFVYFLFVCLFAYFCLFVTFENDRNLLWVYHFAKFLGKNQDKGRQFQFLPRASDTHATPLSLTTMT